MTKKEIAERLKEIKNHIKDDMEDFAAIDFKELALEIHNDRKYHLVIENFNKIKKLVSNQVPFYCFELAYAFENQNDIESSEIVYEYLNAENGENAAVLNNLSNIKKGKRKFKEAFELISKAYEIAPDDEVISNNYDSLFQIISDLNEREQKFKHSLTYLERENKFVIDKLKTFIQNAKKDKDFKNGLMPIPKWKFKVLMVTDDDKAESLRNQWLDKNYIVETGERGDYYVIVYEINPFLEKAISELTFKVINPNWILGIEKLNTKDLEELNYYRNLKKINKVNRQFKGILKRDYDELTFNFLVKSNKSTIILAGSLIETLLIYHLKKKKIKKISYEINTRTVSKDLLEATLNDLLKYLEQNKMLENHFVHLGNISRIFRNYVHPGKELRETEELDDAKANLCYISASELINSLI